MLKPTTPEEVLQVKMTTRLNQGLLAVEDAVLAMKVLPMAEANTAARDAVVKQLRQTALDVGGTVTQIRPSREALRLRTRFSARQRATKGCRLNR